MFDKNVRAAYSWREQKTGKEEKCIMPVYDFDTLHPRYQTGSAKWRQLDEKPAAGIFPFSVADMDFKTAPEISAALQKAAQGAIFGYHTAQADYYAAVCAWQKRRHGYDCQPQWLVQVPNIVQALYRLVSIYTEPGDGIIVQPPVYPPIYQAVEKQGRKLLANNLCQTGNTYTMDLADLATKAADPSARMLILCSPHNPVGRVWHKEELLKLVQICRQNNILIISDEIHADLVFSSHPHTSLGCITDALDNLVICSSPSKTFNLASLGNANLIIPNQKIKQQFQLAQERAGLTSTNYFGTVACQAAYEKAEDWYLALLAYLRGNLLLFNNYMMRELPQLPVSQLEGTYLGWINMQALQMSWQERQSWLESHDLYLVSGSIFGKTATNFERINLALPRQALLNGLEKLKQAVASL